MPDRRGEFGTVAARAEQPHRRQRHVRGHGVHGAERMALGKAAAFQHDQFLKTLEELITLAGVLPSAQRVGGDRIGPRRAAEAEIDAAGKQRLQYLETFRDHRAGRGSPA